eukprot:5766168-Pyramimonas_sp.AAC.1
MDNGALLESTSPPESARITLTPPMLPCTRMLWCRRALWRAQAPRCTQALWCTQALCCTW